MLRDSFSAAAPAREAGDQLAMQIRSSLRKRGWQTLRYLATTEAHTFAFSVAANAILSFFPFIVLLMTLTRRVFHSTLMSNVIVELLREFLPAGQDFIVRNLNAMVNAHKGAQIISLLVLLFTSNGVFLPLEVALNRVWGFGKNRSYLGNQLVSLGLAFASGVLALLSIALTAGNQLLLRSALQGIVFDAIAHAAMKAFALVASIAIFFLIYWLLPNGKVRVRAVLPAAVVTGIFWELAKYLYIAVLPWLDFKEVYGPFSLSVTLMFWAFLTGLMVLGGGHLAAGRELSR
jgi:membrane protein